MKKIFILLFASMLSLTSFAQRVDKPGEPYEYYITITPELDLKMRIKALITMQDEKYASYIADENNEKKVFNALYDIINYMTKRGWCYVGEGNSFSNRVLIFKKIVKSDDEARELIVTVKKK